MADVQVRSAGRFAAGPLGRESIGSTVQRQFQIFYALMMHDIKARFFGNGLGYITMMAWPFLHMVAIIAMYVFSGRVTPYGDSLILYSATGVIPYIASIYIAKFMLMGAIMNKAFMQYPVIKILDIFTARALLELINLSVVTAITIVGMMLMGIDCMPVQPIQAAEAFGASLLLGVGLGYLNGVITWIVPLWNVVFSLLGILLYVLAGILFVPSSLPLEIQYYLSFNPMIHAVVWMRGSFYPSYSEHILDKTYLIEWGVISLFLGLVLERVLRAVASNPQ